MVLFTFNKKYEDFAIRRLESQNIKYVIQPVGNDRWTCISAERSALTPYAWLWHDRSTCSRPKKTSCSALCSATTSARSVRDTVSVRASAAEKLFRHWNYGKRATKKPLTAVSGFFVSINIRIDYPKLSYIILLPLIFNELRLSGDGIARKRRFGPTPVDHFVDANEMVYRLASHFLPDLVLSQMIIATTTARNAANVTIA